MQEDRHSGARALPENPESRNTDQRNQWLGLCSWIPGPALTGRPGMTREFFSTLLVAAFDFRWQIAFLKFIGTHAEYDRVDALTASQF
jgi:hypothetical protein